MMTLRHRHGLDSEAPLTVGGWRLRLALNIEASFHTWSWHCGTQGEGPQARGRGAPSALQHRPASNPGEAGEQRGCLCARPPLWAPRPSPCQNKLTRSQRPVGARRRRPVELLGPSKALAEKHRLHFNSQNRPACLRAAGPIGERCGIGGKGNVY